MRNCFAHDFGMRLVDELRRIGWLLSEKDGRWRRMKAPSRTRRHGTVPPLESELYDGSADHWFNSRTARNRLPLTIVHTDAHAVDKDIEAFRKLIHSKGVREDEYQRFLSVAC